MLQSLWTTTLAQRSVPDSFDHTGDAHYAFSGSLAQEGISLIMRGWLYFEFDTQKTVAFWICTHQMLTKAAAGCLNLCMWLSLHPKFILSSSMPCSCEGPENCSSVGHGCLYHLSERVAAAHSCGMLP